MLWEQTGLYACLEYASGCIHGHAWWSPEQTVGEGNFMLEAKDVSEANEAARCRANKWRRWAEDEQLCMRLLKIEQVSFLGN